MANPVPTDPNALLRRTALAAALTESGYPIAPATLATMATRGGGPPFHKFGARVLYRWSETLAWAQSRLSAPRRNTSEGDAIDQFARTKTPADQPPPEQG